MLDLREEAVAFPQACCLLTWPADHTGRLSRNQRGVMGRARTSSGETDPKPKNQLT
jgi:hypothetical protein